MKIKSLVLGLFVASLAITGCVNRIGDFTIVSTKNYVQNQYYKKAGRFTGEDRPFIGIPNLKNAVDRCIEKSSNGIYLTNAVISVHSGFLGFGAGYIVTGDVFMPATTGEIQGDKSELYTLSTKDGQMQMVPVIGGKAEVVSKF